LRCASIWLAAEALLEALDASLELLRILHRSRHPTCSPGEIEATRRRIFDAAA
jgi:hypothetical protein